MINSTDINGILKCICGKTPVFRHVSEEEKSSMNDYWQIGCHHVEKSSTIVVKADNRQTVIDEWNNFISKKVE